MQAIRPETPASESAASVVATPSQYLTFQLSGEIFAIGILAIKEIIEYGGLTVVPMMPACIRGVINLRGDVVPVMDLSVRFGRPSTEVTKRTCVIIAEVAAGSGRQDVGVVVDAVHEVIDIAPSDIEPAPMLGMRLRHEFLLGMGKVHGRFVMLLDPERVLSTEELAAVAHAATAEPVAA